mmetsp:Transcript_110793/g.238486  ORF Transcript_110793/g.238486 Transcript_110793/m.238486 type:complete len:391 (-) Transcript_110793:438-1610(-)
MRAPAPRRDRDPSLPDRARGRAPARAGPCGGGCRNPPCTPAPSLDALFGVRVLHVLALRSPVGAPAAHQKDRHGVADDGLRETVEDRLLPHAEGRRELAQGLHVRRPLGLPDDVAPRRRPLLQQVVLGLEARLADPALVRGQGFLLGRRRAGGAEEQGHRRGIVDRGLPRLVDAEMALVKVAHHGEVLLGELVVVRRPREFAEDGAPVGDPVPGVIHLLHPRDHGVHVRRVHLLRDLAAREVVLRVLRPDGEVGELRGQGPDVAEAREERHVAGAVHGGAEHPNGVAAAGLHVEQLHPAVRLLEARPELMVGGRVGLQDLHQLPGLQRPDRLVAVRGSQEAAGLGDAVDAEATQAPQPLHLDPQRPLGLSVLLQAELQGLLLRLAGGDTL